MRSFFCVAVLISWPAGAVAADWLQWRGPTGDNHAPADATAPTSWDENNNIAWIKPVPGRGHSSPTVVGDRIYLTTSDETAQTQSLLIYDRHTGKQLAEKVAHQGGLNAKLHPNNTHASSTVASDSERVFALFNNDGAAWITAFDLTGNQLWQQRAIGFLPKTYEFGFGSSPVVVGDLVIVASEYDGDESGIVALDAQTGEQRWKAERPKLLSYSTPARATINGRMVLLLSGNHMLAGLDPAGGNHLWSAECPSQATCGTMVWNERQGLAFASGGYPVTFTSAVRTDGNHEVVWTNSKIKAYEQSMLVVGDYLYVVADTGLVYCLRCADGEQLWKERVSSRGISSSPILIDGKIYFTNEQGTTFVFAPTPEGYTPLGENQLGTECFATPTPVGNRLYHRFANGKGAERKEYLAAIGK